MPNLKNAPAVLLSGRLAFWYGGPSSRKRVGTDRFQPVPT